MMKDFAMIKSLVGDSVREEELVNVDYYVHSKMGLFIPSVGTCGYAQRINHTHPSYMVVISFIKESMNRNHYDASVLSPDIPHWDISEEFNHYYCILIEKEYFEKQYKLYTDQVPRFEHKEFSLCSDILKILNTFAFEYTKTMQNFHITLDAQATIITHWIIRSILGENMDAHAISSNYEVARAQHHMEQYYGGNITVGRLAELGHMSVSRFSRIFKKELRMTPIQYLIEIRIGKSKLLLRREEISITEIAAKCGFSSSAHFAAEFKRITGITPSEYRISYYH